MAISQYPFFRTTINKVVPNADKVAQLFKKKAI